MYTILLVGSVGVGKTTLRQRLTDDEIVACKTQSIEAFGHYVDTPGEYFDYHRFWSALQVTSAQADVVLLLDDATAEQGRIPPGIAATFGPQTVGVVTKASLARPHQVASARDRLSAGGAEPVFVVDSLTGVGIEEVRAFLWPTS